MVLNGIMIKDNQIRQKIVGNPFDISKKKEKKLLVFLSIVFLFCICFPRNNGAFPLLCRALRYIDVFVFVFSTFLFFYANIYGKAWYTPLVLLFIWMIICTLAMDPNDIVEAFTQVFRMASVFILSEFLMQINVKRGFIWLSRIWALFLIVQWISYITKCFGYTETSNTASISNYFFGIRVEINEYIIYSIAFILFSIQFVGFFEKLYYIFSIAVGTCFVFSESVSTSILAIVIFGVIMICSSFIKKSKIWKLLLILVVIFAVLFAYLQNTEGFAWLLEGVLKEDISLNGRTLLWNQAIEQSRGIHLIFGYGFIPEFKLFLSSGFSVNHPHNQYLQFIYNFGLPGLILYLFMVYKMINNISKINNGFLKSVHIACLVSTTIMCISSRNYMYLTAQIYYVLSNYLSDMNIIKDKKRSALLV